MSFFTSAILSGCGGGSSAPTPSAIAISLNGGGSKTISPGQSIVLTADVSNDPSGKGVIWKLSGPGVLSKQTGTSVQYDAPTSLTNTASATLTATSVADPSKSATLTITINAKLPQSLTISTTSLPDGVVGTPYSQSIQATGGVAPFTWLVSAGTLPHNLNLDGSTTSTLTVSGTPDTQQAAVQFTIKVTDSANQSAAMSYTINININGLPAPTIDTSSVPQGTINVTYPSFSFLASGGSPPVTWSESGTLPPGMNLAKDGTLSGTPTVSGSFPIRITVTDSKGQAATKPFTIVISAAAIVIDTSSVPSGTINVTYPSFSFSASGGSPPVTWSESGTLPPGMNFGSDGALSGTPTVSGSFPITVTVTDGKGQAATKPFTIVISAAAIVIDTSSVPQGTINVAYPSFSFSASGGSAPLSWSESGALPSGMNFGSDGALSGTPTISGSFSITVTVTDSKGQTAVKPFAILISAAATLNGRYLFQFQGFNSAGAFAAVGSFNADGVGNISDAVLDTNGVAEPPATNLALSGTYYFDANNFGTMTLSGPQGNATFRFALYPSASSGISAGGTIFEFDNIRSGTGFIAAQDTTAFSKSTITGNYLLNFVGSSANGRAAAVGALTADGIGGFNSGVMDVNESGTLTADAAFNGSYDVSAASTNGRGTATLNATLAGTPVTLHFSFYIENIDTIPNAAVLIFMGTDPVSATLPLLSGSMEPHAVVFNNNSLKGSLILGATGLTSGGMPDVTLGALTIPSTGNYALSTDENNGGVITSSNISTGTYNVEPSGRVTLTGGNFPLVFYLSGQNTGYVMGTDGRVSTGTLSGQTVPLSLEGTLFVRTGAPVSGNQENDFGRLAFSSSTVAGSMNVGSSSSFQTNIPVAGTYSLGPGGKGNLSITSGLHTGTSVFYLSGHSQLLLLNSDSTGDIAPVLFSGGCIHFVISPRGGVTCQ